MTTHTYVNRWTVSLSWIVGMLIVWSLLVPRPVSVTTFVLFGATGLVVSVFGATFLKDSQPPRSMTAILGEVDGQPKTESPSRQNR
jgi:hypothetical protein